jgi:hypothetical protein
MYDTSDTVAGTLAAGGTPPGNPSISSVSPGDGTVTLTVVAADAADRVYVVYRHNINNEPISAQNITFSRIGSGTITVTGLVNAWEYEFYIYAKTGTISSTYIGPVYAAPVDDCSTTARLSLRTEMRDQMASAALEVARNVGVVVSYTPLNGTASSLYAIELQQSQGEGLLSGRTDRHELGFEIPRQTNFPPAAFQINDFIDYDGVRWALRDVQTDTGNISQASVFVLTVHRTGLTANYA